MNGGSNSSPSGGAVVPPGMNNANGTPGMPGMPMGGASSSNMATPSSPTAVPTAVQVAGAPQQQKSLAGLAVAVVGVFALGRL